MATMLMYQSPMTPPLARGTLAAVAAATVTVSLANAAGALTRAAGGCATRPPTGLMTATASGPRRTDGASKRLHYKS